MPDLEKAALPQLAEILHFKPRIWWDPVPWWVFQHLRPESIRELAVIQLELEKSVLEAQIRAADKAMGMMRQLK